MKANQKGFTLVEGLLILLVLSVIGFGGYYVWSSRNTEDAPTQPAQKQSEKTQTVDPTKDWTSYTSELGKFSLKYPKDWATATNPDLCANTALTGIFMLGADASSVGKCATDSGGQITITWRTDRQLCGELSSEAWTQNSKQTVTIGGVRATKIEATAKEVQGIGDPVGTKTTQYCAVANNVTYIANYTQLSSYPDVLDDFNLMVTKTLKFD